MTTKRVRGGTEARKPRRPVSAVEASILRGLDEAVAFTRGDRRGARVTTVPVTARAATARRARRAALGIRRAVPGTADRSAGADSGALTGTPRPGYGRGSPHAGDSAAVNRLFSMWGGGQPFGSWR